VTEPAEYELSGDFEESPMTGMLTSTGIEDITLTTGLGIKHVTVRYSTGDDERTITKTIEYVTYCDTITDVSTGECEGLVALYESTNGSEWTDQTNWL
jgi:hypothetical protein